MNPPNHRTIWRQGLWDNNPGLVQLLGLCPLLAVTTTATNGLGLGLATVGVLVITNALISVARHHIARDIRIPVFVLVIASAVTVVDLLLQAHLPALSTTLGIFIPLIVTNCTILGRAEAFASRQPVWPAIQDGLAQGLGFLAVLVVLGGLRELIGQGTLFANADVLLGPWAQALSITVAAPDSGFLLMMLPPGAFLTLAAMIAARQWWVQRQPTPTQASERADATTHEPRRA
ncbi:MAG: electron transport complex subunit E [Wenzhouxiangella sp.]|jgi:electron transport complex protein RnfE|nr:electron transport complex subunit E [Wenzhouxiangella sp.]MDR9453372.1 electron transport complex subunit E [Wenzhouxiangella sp.]